MDPSSLILDLPFSLVEQLSKLNGREQLQLCGKAAHEAGDVSIEAGRYDGDKLQITMSGSGFMTLFQDTYRCHVASVSDPIQHAAYILNTDSMIQTLKTLPAVASNNSIVRQQNLAEMNRQNSPNCSQKIHIKDESHELTTQEVIFLENGMTSDMPRTVVLSDQDESLTQTILTTGSVYDASNLIGDVKVEDLSLVTENNVIGERTHVDRETNIVINLEINQSDSNVEADFPSNVKCFHEETDNVNGYNTTSVNEDYFLATNAKELMSDSVKARLIKMALKCSLCRYAAVNVGTFRSHLKDHHNISWKDYKANYDISTGFEKERQFDNSEGVEKSECLGSFQQKENLDTFKRKKRTDVKKSRKRYALDPENNSFACELCGLKYKSKGSLSLHLRNKHKGNARLKDIFDDLKEQTSGRKSTIQTECTFCAKIFAGGRIFSHMKVSHADEVDFDSVYKAILKRFNQAIYERTRDDYTSDQSCPHCGIQLKKCSMRRHIENHCKKNYQKQHRFHCHLCAFFSTDKAVTDSHKASEHQTRPEYICDVCGACFHTTVGLRQHARIKHQAVWKKPIQWWTCQQCNKQFSSRMNLERHKSVHTREYQYSCGECGKKFKDSSSLITHKRNLHEGIYRYRCEQCGHGMERKKYLTTHKCAKSSKSSSQETTPSLRDNIDSNNTLNTEEEETIPEDDTTMVPVEPTLTEAVNEELTFVLQGDDSQVAIAMDELGNFQSVQTEDGSVITMDAGIANLASEISGEGESIMVVMDADVGVSGENQTLAMNATLSDGSTVILLPSDSLDQAEQVIMDATEYLLQ